ncbi:Mannan-binding lectin serine protease 1 [Portunus trituberculatus]|uniref:Mannan-binding lectin serine protease 1 n=1 Tax=Portunus trituberculatus TaxID=210409 RepID=A0A5B7IWA7_PORTR|nr:Mannan-binding lectin serine protease 1 [Portunus trituberculatus]
MLMESLMARLSSPNFSWPSINLTSSREHINECAWSDKLVCDHYCENTKGGFQCSCHHKYILQSDNVTCKHQRKYQTTSS